MNTPIFNKIREYAESGSVPFHMPGHKMGKGLPCEFIGALAALDITEIPGTDYLHQPSGIIKEAQTLAAQAFGADRSYFLVNGSTCGIYAIIQAVCKPGDSMIVARDCHKSVIHAMMLSKVNPVYVLPEYDDDFGITTIVTPERLKQTLEANPGAVGVLLTRPNYYGVCCDIERITGIVHSYGKVLAVDEAHGAHLKFGSRLPVSAMEAGADICVQSAHKTLSALTQGAYLHVKSERVDIDRLQFFISLYQTTSPSYLIMASLDIARELMQTEGRQLLDGLVDIIRHEKRRFSGSQVEFLAEPFDGKYRTDATRITACLRNLGVTGYQGEQYLRNAYNIQAEMSDLLNVVFIATVADSEDSIGRLFDGLEKLGRAYMGGESLAAVPACTYLDDAMARQQINFEDVMQAESVPVAMRNAAGKVSKDIISPYPPGIPIICPGELISPKAIDFLLDVIKAGGKVNGINENLEINVI